MKTLDRQIDETLATERLVAILAEAFGILVPLLDPIEVLRYELQFTVNRIVVRLPCYDFRNRF